MNIKTPKIDGDTELLLQAILDSPPPAPRLSEIGQVAEVADGIAIVTGLERALSNWIIKGRRRLAHRYAVIFTCHGPLRS